MTTRDLRTPFAPPERIKAALGAFLVHQTEHLAFTRGSEEELVVRSLEIEPVRWNLLAQRRALTNPQRERLQIRGPVQDRVVEHDEGSRGFREHIAGVRVVD